ncbi:MAG: acryloyl-CoA reductase [Chloroflexota bacterium]
MSGTPERFRAYVVDRPDDGGFTRGLRELTVDELPPGELLVRVAWSTVNYKDGLAAREDGKVVRAYPLVPGIDLVGEVVESADPAFAIGEFVIASGYDFGVSRHGGFAELARVPSSNVVPLPDGLGPRDAMAIGTAGFTAALSVVALEARGLAPSSGPVLVTGASGGVGGRAVGILAARGYEVWAATRKDAEQDRLRGLGAVGFVAADDIAAPGKPLERARWAGAVDTVGGVTLPYVLRSLQPGGAVAASGNAGGAELTTTVLPFILRGVALLGIESSQVPIGERQRIWGRLATDLRPRGLSDAISEVDLDGVEGALDAIVAGEARGRWVVRIGG